MPVRSDPPRGDVGSQFDSRTIRHLADLYALYGCRTHGDFNKRMQDRWSEPADWWYAEVQDGSGDAGDPLAMGDTPGDDPNTARGAWVRLRVYCFHPDGYFDSDELCASALTFPFAENDFWGVFDELDRALEPYRRAAELPTPTGQEELPEFLMRLSELLGTAPGPLLEAVGGGWRSVEGPTQGWAAEPVQRWYASGNPVQILMGIGGIAVHFAVPYSIEHQVSGDVVHEIDQAYRVVPLDSTTLLSDLTDACRLVRSEYTRGWSVCHSCRRYAMNLAISGTNPCCPECVALLPEDEEGSA